MKQHAFSLVELSIVLVILGLLVGGILAGQSLVKAAELRSVTTENQRFLTATHIFLDKYAGLPGDLNNATLIWGKDNTNCAAHSGTAATPGTCNGNGDGVMGVATAINSTGEAFQFWKQLSLAGLLEGNFTGLSGPGAPFAGYDTVLGTNAPRSRLNNAGWGLQNYNSGAGNGSTYAFNYGNEFVFGGQTTGNLPYAPVLRPEQAWNIDTKTDDGRPGSGSIIAMYWNNACATASSASDYASGYNLASTGVQCVLNFARQF